MAIPQTNDQKQQLRREMRQLLKVSDRQNSQVLIKVRDRLKALENLKTVAIYSPLAGEIDLTPLVAEMPHLRWVFPRIEQSELVLHIVADTAHDLHPGAFGIREPALDLPTVSFFEVDAFLCPGLAFDEYGGRLGRGRGFYDKMLETARADALKIGVCRSEQIVPDTFGEPHDIVMNEVIS